MNPKWKNYLKPSWQGVFLTTIFAIFMMLFVYIIVLSSEISCIADECTRNIPLYELYSFLGYSVQNLFLVVILIIILFYLFVSLTINLFKKRRKR